ncbi:hypothetical protein [Arcobacter sp. CECT 8985]|uniref:hypothetical protein n=1 Tax=Arcobacter sp. CECT 8985 TaxID=1935424 RepID=UPI00100A920A|nr:hypothetical protein [Arcobacter sp. CECT 8985]RXJ86056.1 hypothetical protein CRU93_10365 [Arcobacter sp. CECT 8985]
MKYTKILLIIFITITFNACTTTNQANIEKSNNQQISELLDEIQKKDAKIEKLQSEIEKLKAEKK